MAQSKRGRAFWRGLAAEVDGGASVAAVALKHNVLARSLSWWLWRLRKDGDVPRRQGRPRLLPVVLRQSSPVPPRSIEIAAGGALVRVEVGTDVEYVAALVRSIARQC